MNDSRDPRQSIQAQAYNEKPLDTAAHVRQERHIVFMKRLCGEPSKKYRGPFDSLLDIGCATGATLAAFPDCKDRAGVDISPRQVAIACKQGYDCHVANMERDVLPFDDDRFDCVVATEVVEHVINTDHLLNEANRVLKPGGLFVASVPNVAQPASFIMLMLDRPPLYAARYRCLHYRDFTKSVITRVIAKHGFNVIQCEGNYIFPMRNALSCVIARYFPRLAEQTFVAGIKERRVEIEDGYSGNYNDLLRWFKEEPGS